MMKHQTVPFTELEVHSIMSLLTQTRTARDQLDSWLALAEIIFRRRPNLPARMLPLMDEQRARHSRYLELERLLLDLLGGAPVEEVDRVPPP